MFCDIRQRGRFYYVFNEILLMRFAVNLKDINSKKLILDFGSNPLNAVSKELNCRLVTLKNSAGQYVCELIFKDDTAYIMFVARYLK